MKLIGDPSYYINGWFSRLLDVSGWFDQEEISETGETPPVVIPSRRRSKRSPARLIPLVDVSVVAKSVSASFSLGKVKVRTTDEVTFGSKKQTKVNVSIPSKEFAYSAYVIPAGVQGKFSVGKVSVDTSENVVVRHTNALYATFTVGKLSPPSIGVTIDRFLPFEHLRLEANPYLGVKIIENPSDEELLIAAIMLRRKHLTTA